MDSARCSRSSTTCPIGTTHSHSCTKSPTGYDNKLLDGCLYASSDPSHCPRFWTKPGLGHLIYHTCEALTTYLPWIAQSHPPCKAASRTQPLIQNRTVYHDIYKLRGISMLIPTIQYISRSSAQSQECGCPRLLLSPYYIDVWLDDCTASRNMSIQLLKLSPKGRRRISLATFPTPR